MGRPLPWDYWRLWLAERFGWTLEYVDALDHTEVLRAIDILTSADKAMADNQRKLIRQQQMRARRG